MQAENKAEDSAHYKPKLLGGSVSFDTNLKRVDSGCVAGLYLVKTDEGCGQGEMEGDV